MTVTTGDGGSSLVLTKKRPPRTGDFTPRREKHAAKREQMKRNSREEASSSIEWIVGVAQAGQGHLTAAFGLGEEKVVERGINRSRRSSDNGSRVLSQTCRRRNV